MHKLCVKYSRLFFHVQPMFCNAFRWHIPTPPQGDHFTVIVDLLRPISPGGEVRLCSADLTVQPYINLNFCADDLDLIAMREGVRFVDDIIMNSDGMKDLVGEDYPWPMPRASDEASLCPAIWYAHAPPWDVWLSSSEVYGYHLIIDLNS